MKKVLFRFPTALLIMALSCGIFFACEPEVIPDEENKENTEGGDENGGEETPGDTEDKTPVFTVSLSEAGPTYADVNMTSKNIYKVAYKVYTERKTGLRPAAVFTGTEVAMPEGGEGVVRISTAEMTPKTEYYVYFAAQDTEVSYFENIY